MIRVERVVVPRYPGATGREAFHVNAVVDDLGNIKEVDFSAYPSSNGPIRTEVAVELAEALLMVAGEGHRFRRD